MGNTISTNGATTATTSKSLEHERTLILGADKTRNGDVLFLNDIEAEPAAWSQEGICMTVQRLFGILPNSKAEVLKQEQKVPTYTPRVSTTDPLNGGSQSRGEAIVKVQRVYRRYRTLRRWHEVAFPILELARNQLEAQYVHDEEIELLANFRQILANGFSAQKVSITGELKNVQLQLVLQTEEQECYLTWSPSRKRSPRIHLHDIVEVVPVLKEGNKYAPRLASKISHRRGLIIVCKSHHRGRVVLQVSSKRERKVLLLGFTRLLEDVNRFDPTLDDTGAIRSRLPRQQSVMQFFDGRISQQEGSLRPSMASSSNDDVIRRSSAISTSENVVDKENVLPKKVLKRHSTSIEHFYQTRFDSPALPAAMAKDATDQPAQPIKPSLFRRSSMTVGGHMVK